MKAKQNPRTAACTPRMPTTPWPCNKLHCLFPLTRAPVLALLPKTLTVTTSLVVATTKISKTVCATDTQRDETRIEHLHRNEPLSVDSLSMQKAIPPRLPLLMTAAVARIL